MAQFQFGSLFGSKKFKTFLVGVIGVVATQFLGLDPHGEIAQQLGMMTSTALGAQGLADFRNGGSTEPKA